MSGLLGVGARTWARLGPRLDAALDALSTGGTASSDRPAITTDFCELIDRARRLVPDTLPKLLGRGDSGASDDAAPSAGASEGSEIGPYRLLRELGRGGMGTVWLAERSDALIGRRVALKLPRAAHPERGLGERLARERDILATLTHPHIARLYDAGVDADGRPWIAIEHVEGCRIDAFVRERSLAVAARIELVLQVADAVAYAHERRVIHRDLKPANILVDAAGRVRLLDFGIAKLLEGDDEAPETDLTRAGGPALTPEYASPEQFRGEAVSERSDVYSLGVVLYELLAGTRPHAADRHGAAALEDAILHTDPRRPSAAAGSAGDRRAIRGDLDRVVMKALAKSAAERYAGVRALADDLRAVLDGRPVQARAPAWSYRASKFARRHRVVVGAAAAVVATVLIGVGVASRQAMQATAQTEALQQTREFIVSILGDTDPYFEPSRALPAQALLERARERLDTLGAARADVRVELLNLIGWNLLRMQRTDDGATVIEQALRESRAALPPGHAQALRARLMQVVVMRYRGEPRAMRAEIDRLLPLLRARADADPIDLIIALRNDANLASSSEGRPEHALRAAREALALSRARFGETHSETVMSHAVLAGAAVGALPSQEALSISSRALELAERVFGQRGPHAMVIQVRSMHASALANAGRLIEAIDAVERVRSDGVAVFGAGVMGEGYDWRHLAQLHTERGDTDAALAAAQRALDIFARHVKPESAHVASVLAQRGLAQLIAGRAELALVDLDTALARQTAALGAAHDTTRSTRALHALALARGGVWAEALRALAPMLADAATLAPRVAALVHHAAGVAQRNSGDDERALAQQRLALAALERADARFSRQHHAWLPAAIRHEAGRALLALGQADEASEMLAAADAQLAALQPVGSPLRSELRAELDGARKPRLAAAVR